MNDSQAASLTEVAAEVRQAATRLVRRLRAERSPDALSLNKLSVLSNLRRHGPATAGGLAAADHQQPQSLTRVFAELQRDGLISRVRGQEDRRQAMLDITVAGTSALTRDMAERDAWLAAALTELTETERQVVRLAAGLIDQIAGREHGTSPPSSSGP
jgi:DNA-binding MarR family transcriptional regulator